MDQNTRTNSNNGQPAVAVMALHALIVGAITAIFGLLTPPILLIGAFSGLVGAAVVLIIVPTAYIALVCLVTRQTTGRAHVLWTIIMTATLALFGTMVSVASQDLPLFGGMTGLPVTLGVAGALSSLAAMPGFTRFVGITAMVAQVAVSFVPSASAQAQRDEQQSAQDVADLAHRNTYTRPYIVPGLVIQLVLPSDYQTDVKLSRDPEAPVREAYRYELGDITLSTAPLAPTESAESEACRGILDPERGGSTSNVCKQIDPDTWWLRAAQGEESLVHLRDGFRLEISDGRHDTDALLSLLDSVEPMPVAQFGEWNAWLLERDKRA